MAINIESVSFDLTDCVLRQDSQCRRAWLNEKDSIAHLLRFSDRPVAWNFDLTNPASASEFYGQQCDENGGAMIELKAVEIQGKEALRGIFKYRAAPEGLAMMYVGIIWLPFSNCNFQINVESMETGTTGMREAAVELLEPSESDPDAPVITVKSGQNLFRRLKQAKVRRLRSDDPRYDRLIKDHPLSKVRARLYEICNTLSFDSNFQSIQPFRLTN